MAPIFDFLFGSNEEQQKVAPTLTDVKPSGVISKKKTISPVPTSSAGSTIFNLPPAQITPPSATIKPSPPKPIREATAVEKGLGELATGYLEGLFTMTGGARSVDDEEVELARIAMQAGDTGGARSLLNQYNERKQYDRYNDPMAFINLSDEYYPPSKVEELWRGLAQGIGQFGPTAILTGPTGVSKKAGATAVQGILQYGMKALEKASVKNAPRIVRGAEILAREAVETGIFSALRSQTSQEFKQNAITDYITMFPSLAAFHGGSALVKKGGNALMEFLSRAGAKQLDITQTRMKDFLEGKKDPEIEQVWETMPTESKALLLQSQLDENYFLQSKTGAKAFAELRKGKEPNNLEELQHALEQEQIVFNALTDRAPDLRVYTNKRTGELPDMSEKRTSGKYGTGKDQRPLFAREGDVIAQQYGMEPEELQAHQQRIEQSRKRIKKIKQDIDALKKEGTGKIEEPDNILRPNERERSFLKNIVQKENVDPIRKEIASQIYPKTYQQLPNKTAIEFGDEYVAKDAESARKFIDEPVSEDSGAFQIATANALQKLYQDMGMFEEAAAMDEKIDILAREGGRMAQIVRAIYRGTPETRMRSAIIATNKALKEADLPPLSKEELARMNELRKKAEAIQEKIDNKKLSSITKPEQLSMKLEMKDLYEQQRALRDMEQIAEDRIPSTLLDRYETFRIGNMLSAPITQATNTASAALNTGVRGVSMQIESLIEALKYVAKKNPKEAKDILKKVNFLTYVRDLYEGFGYAKTAFLDTLQGKKPIGEKFNEFAARRRNVLKNTGKTTKGMIGLQTEFLRLMSASDQFFRTLNKYPEVREAKFLQGLEDDAITLERAARAAETTILSNDLDFSEEGITLVEQAARGFGRTLQTGQNSRAVGPAFAAIQSHIIPFIKVLVNMTGYGLKHSPLGFIPGIKTGGLSKRSLAEAITGTAAMTIFAAMGLDTTWSAPQDKSLRDAFYDANKQPFSFRVPGTNKWVSYQYAGPLAPAMAFLGALQYQFKENPDAILNSDLEKISQSLLGTIVYAFTQSPARGIQNALSLLTEPSDSFNQSKALKSLGFTTTQNIPLSSLGRWANNYFLDKVYRKSEGAIDEWLKTIPTASKNLKPYRNTETGEEQKRETINAILPFGGLRTVEPEKNQKFLEKVQNRQVTRLTNKRNDLLTEILEDNSMSHEEKQDAIKENPILQRYLNLLNVQ